MENGEWVGYLNKPKPARCKKSKTQTVSKTAPKLSTPRLSSPASGTSKYNWLYKLKLLWRGLGSPWYTVCLSGLLGISSAYAISYYLQTKYLTDIIVKSGILN